MPPSIHGNVTRDNYMRATPLWREADRLVRTFKYVGTHVQPYQCIFIYAILRFSPGMNSAVFVYGIDVPIVHEDDASSVEIAPDWVENINSNVAVLAIFEAMNEKVSWVSRPTRTGPT
jgi:hypothetical protein